MDNDTKVFSAELNRWRNAHNLSGADLATLCGVSKQMVSDVLAGRRAFSAETAFNIVEILNKFQGTQMNNQNQTELEALDLVNKSVLARHLGKSKIKYFQSTVENSGWLPGVTDEPDLAEAINVAIQEGDYKYAADLLAALQKAPKATPSIARRAGVNRSGSTRNPVVGTNGTQGRRPTLIDGQSFSAEVRKYSAEDIAKAEKELKAGQRKLVAASYEPAEQKVNFTGSIVNPDSLTDVPKIKRLHVKKFVQNLEK